MTFGEFQIVLHDWQRAKRLDQLGYTFSAESRGEGEDTIEFTVWKRTGRKHRPILSRRPMLHTFETAGDVHDYAERQWEIALQG